MKNILQMIWKDIVIAWDWLVKEAESWYANGGQAILQSIESLAVTAGTQFLADNPTGVFLDFLPFVVNYIKTNWKNDLIQLEDSVVHWVASGVAMKLGVPTTANQGNLVNGVQQGG